MKVFSVDFKGEMALFKKNDANDLVFTSYNFIHKPVVLGLFGAILGISGYSKSGLGKHPEYYEKLKNVKIAIQPLFEKPLQKVITGFNNATGHANMGANNDGATWQVREQILVGEPMIGFRVFIKGNKDIDDLIDKMKNYLTTYPLYFGKNEFFAYYENFQEYECYEIDKSVTVVKSLIKKGESNNIVEKKEFSVSEISFTNPNKNLSFIIFENLPYDLDEHGFYRKDLFVWTGYEMKIKDKTEFRKLVDDSGISTYVQFF